jgi:hypothetical protein
MHAVEEATDGAQGQRSLLFGDSWRRAYMGGAKKKVISIHDVRMFWMHGASQVSLLICSLRGTRPRKVRALP